jgi:hypothetical protein
VRRESAVLGELGDRRSRVGEEDIGLNGSVDQLQILKN